MTNGIESWYEDHINIDETPKKDIQKWTLFDASKGKIR